MTRRFEELIWAELDEDLSEEEAGELAALRAGADGSGQEVGQEELHEAGLEAEIRRFAARLAEVEDPNIQSGATATHAGNRDKQKPKKLSFNEQRELDQLPEQIETLETRIDELLKKISASDFYSQEFEQTGPVLQEFAEFQQALDLALERWSELEDQQQQYQQSRT